MHVCNPARVWTLQRLVIWSTFWLHTTFCNSFWNLCSASAIQLLLEPRQLLCHPAHSHLLYVKTINKTHHSGFARFVSGLFYQWHVPKFSSQFLSWHESSNLSNAFVRHAQVQFKYIQTKIVNLKSQIPSFAFHSEPHANAQITLPLYPSLRILCKVLLLQILLISMPAFW